jgi:hypothetical protein
MAKKRAPYGLDRYRTPIRKNEFVYPAGTLPEAVILDLDETFVKYGRPCPDVLAWLKKHYEAGRKIIVITARTDHWEYESSFNMLMADLPYPFIGPICRVADDPRYACEFKRETAEYLSGIYRIVGAADDAQHVNTMWRWWKETYGPEDFDLLECEVPSYADWRKSLPRKGLVKSYTSTGRHRAAGTRVFSGSQGWDQNHGWPSHYATRTMTPLDDYDRDVIDGSFFIEEVGT